MCQGIGGPRRIFDSRTMVLLHTPDRPRMNHSGSWRSRLCRKTSDTYEKYELKYGFTSPRLSAETSVLTARKYWSGPLTQTPDGWTPPFRSQYVGATAFMDVSSFTARTATGRLRSTFAQG